MSRKPLSREFYNRDPVLVARELLGCLLLRATADGIGGGRIVETEAYLSSGDPACHASRGQTRKNRSMFGRAGHAYVYPIHARYCFNVVTEPEDVPSAVLVRAIEPQQGVALLRQRRGCHGVHELASGPAKLCEALAIDTELDGWDLTLGRRLWIAAASDARTDQAVVGRSARIGVTSAHDLPLRFYLKDDPFVSGPKRLRA
jgi:DNA-3-methyladenine glycosylase